MQLTIVLHIQLNTTVCLVSAGPTFDIGPTIRIYIIEKRFEIIFQKNYIIWNLVTPFTSRVDKMHIDMHFNITMWIVEGLEIIEQYLLSIYLLNTNNHII